MPPNPHQCDRPVAVEGELGRWLRFSQRLFLLLLLGTLVGGAWTGWQARIVMHRKAIGRAIEHRHSSVFWITPTFRENSDLFLKGFKLVRPGDQSTRISWLRRLLGDQDADAILFGARNLDREAMDAFPEADIYVAVPATYSLLR